jgi:hypothetical protein
LAGLSALGWIGNWGRACVDRCRLGRVVLPGRVAWAVVSTNHVMGGSGVACNGRGDGRGGGWW